LNNLSKTNLNNIKNRGDKIAPPKKNLSFKDIKKNTISSLNDVEFFLNNFNKIVKCLKLYKILK